MEKHFFTNEFNCQNDYVDDLIDQIEELNNCDNFEDNAFKNDVIQLNNSFNLAFKICSIDIIHIIFDKLAEYPDLYSNIYDTLKKL